MPINAQGGRVRDTQRSRLYDAEDVLHGRRVSTAAKRHLTDTQHVAGRGMWVDGKVVSMKCPTVEAVQAYMNAVTDSAWFKRRWNQRFTYVPGKGSHGAWGRVTVSQVHRRSEAVILHEMAHTLTPANKAWHGPEFAGILLTLVKHVMGAKSAADLRASYRKHRVKYTFAAVPEPKREVVPKSKEVAVKRERDAAVDDRLLRNLTERQRAARVIRAGVKAGWYGPPGAKPRAQALATARTLEKPGKSRYVAEAEAARSRK